MVGLPTASTVGGGHVCLSVFEMCGSLCVTAESLESRADGETAAETLKRF